LRALENQAVAPILAAMQAESDRFARDGVW